MHCQAYVTGERYNIHGICSYLKNTAKYKITFIPEGKYYISFDITNS